MNNERTIEMLEHLIDEKETLIETLQAEINGITDYEDINFLIRSKMIEYNKNLINALRVAIECVQKEMIREALINGEGE